MQSVGDEIKFPCIPCIPCEIKITYYYNKKRLPKHLLGSLIFVIININHVFLRYEQLYQ